MNPSRVLASSIHAASSPPPPSARRLLVSSIRAPRRRPHGGRPGRSGPPRPSFPARRSLLPAQLPPPSALPISLEPPHPEATGVAPSRAARSLLLLTGMAASGGVGRGNGGARHWSAALFVAAEVSGCGNGRCMGRRRPWTHGHGGATEWVAGRRRPGAGEVARLVAKEGKATGPAYGAVAVARLQSWPGWFSPKK
ncbi:hypothetical protein VPH35_072667 [Triticum aestivum]